MSKKLGIFLNNTSSNMKIETNLNNFNQLKENFDYIYILDVNNDFSNKLKSNLSNETKIINYDINTDKINSQFNESLNINNALYVLENIKIKDFDNITFINDNYIYLSNLKEYFDYFDKHNLDFSSFNDSSENNYHYELYIFTLSSIKIPEFIKFYKNNLLDVNNTPETLFENKMVYLKLAYVNSNLECNIFYNNDKLYEFLMDNNFLPIININKLSVLKDSYDLKIFKEVPDDFDIDVYRAHDDLKQFGNDFLREHFINYGQFEMRYYTKKNDCNIFIVPNFIRKKLHQLNLLHFFDIPYDFSLIKYKELNKDLSDFGYEKLIMHYMNFGKFEGRRYN